MSNENKKELELCVLIVDSTTNEFIGFETSQLRMLHLKRSSFNDFLIDRWNTVHFVSDGVENGVTLVKEGSMPRVTAPPANDVKFQDGIPMISCVVMFSGDRKHQSYSKVFAVSDRFGYIEISEEDGKSREFYEPQTKYSCDITFAQWTDRTKPYFKAVTTLLKTSPSPTDNVFFEVTKTFENRMLHEIRERDLAATSVPRGTTREERAAAFVPPRSAPAPPRDFSKVEFRTHFVGMILESYPVPYNRSNGVVWTQHGDVPMLVDAMISGTSDGNTTAGEKLLPGEWVKVRLEYRKERLGVKKFTERFYPPNNMTTRCVRDRNHVEFFVDGPLSLKNKDVLFEKDGLRYIKHFLLGTVEVGPQIYMRNGNADSVRVEYQKIRQWKEVDGHYIYWVVNKKLHDEPIQQPERNGNRSNSPNYPGPSHLSREMEEMRFEPSFDSKSGFNGPSRPDSMIGSIGDGYRQHNHPPPQFGAPMSQYPAPPQSRYQPPPPPSRVSMSQRSQQRDPPITTMAIITGKHSDFLVACLKHNSMAALICDELMDDSRLQLGTLFECDFILRQDTKGTEGIFFEVVDIFRIDDQPFFCRTVGERAELFVHVDLYNIDPKLNASVAFGGQPVLLSHDVEKVLVADRVITPTGEIVGKHELVKMYKNKKMAENMTGFAKFTMTKVPRILMDKDYTGDQEVDTFMWQLVELVGRSSQYRREQQNIEEENLGRERQQYLEEDDIARAKRRNKQLAEQEARGGASEFGSVAGSNYGRQSPSQSFYSARETVYNHPHGSNQYPRGNGNGQGGSGGPPPPVNNSPNEVADLRRLLQKACEVIKRGKAAAELVLQNPNMASQLHHNDFEFFKRMVHDGEDVVQEMYDKNYSRY